MNDNPSETQNTLTRAVEATRIPSGDTLSLPEGTEFTITQALGGAFTIAVPEHFGLFRVGGKDADALGMTLPEPDAPLEPGAVPEVERLWEQLKTCFDPEIPVNIVDLGLVYSLAVTPLEGGSHRVEVKMTLTAPGCGMGPVIAADARDRLLTVAGVGEAQVDVVWEPAWNPSLITADGKAILGID